MTALNNLISRVKNIFGHKATTVSVAPPKSAPPTDLSVVSDPRLNAAFADIEKYLADNYGTPTAKLRAPREPVLPPKMRPLPYRS
ncbi:hypothetical protein [Bacteroides acidifaciens]|uniref:hypothetical protein n=1 Tax=Bacteroides acidifaciens TaxID=85831 RepID=UPI0025A9A443|nr:hypothetical protein [Bacteroides acidifaciens]